jgi:hypothetical protein
MTIQPTEKLGPRKAAILLTVCSVEAVEQGCDLTTYLALNFLLEVCRTYVETPNTNLDATKKAIALAETVMLAMSGSNWFKLTDRLWLEDRSRNTIKSLSWYPNIRTARSWKAYHNPERLLELRIVPLEQFQERSTNTKVYSGYTKGYHESGKGYQRDGMVYGVGKTPFNPDIDEDRVTVPFDNSSPIDEDPEYLSLVNAIQRAKEKRYPRK